MRLVVRALVPNRRRAGLAFTREPVTLLAGDFGKGIAAAERLLAVLTDPDLAAELVEADGRRQPVSAEMVIELDAVIAHTRQRLGTDLHDSEVHLVGELLGTGPEGDEVEQAAAPAIDSGPATSAESAEPDSNLVGGADTEAAAEAVAEAKPAKRGARSSGTGQT